MKQSPGVCAAKGMQSQLLNTVADILNHQQRLIEKHLFSFTLTDVVFLNALATVTLVPLKAYDARQIDHFCILP